MNAVTRILVVAGTLPVLVGVLVVAQGCVNVPGGLILDNGIVEEEGSGGRVLDSDGDGFSDDEETNFTPGTDPLDPTDNPNNVRDTDGDGCSDYDELNFDGFCDNDPDTSDGWVACSTLHDDSTIAGIIELTEETQEGGFTVDDQVALALATCSDFCDGDFFCEKDCLACHVAAIDLVYPLSDAATASCPFELDDGLGFSITIPCGFLRQLGDPVPGATYEKRYANADLVIAVAVFPPSQQAATLPDELISSRLNGPVTTPSGDFLLNVTVEASGLEAEKAIGMLANGDFVQVTVAGASYDQDIQLLAGGLFLSIDLKDTDGSGFQEFLADSANVLQVRPTDRYIVLDDDSVWYVVSNDASVVALWDADDLVLRGAADNSFYDASFMSMTSWQSADVEGSGIGTRGIVAGFNDPEFGAREIVLDNGLVLVSSYADEAKLFRWQEGDPVILVNDAARFGDLYAINLRTGQAVWIP